MTHPCHIFKILVHLWLLTAAAHAQPLDAGTEPASPATFADGLTPSRVLHVVPGAEGPADGSPALPYATLEAAARAATPGTAISLAPGVHAGGAHIRDLAGTAEAPIWITGAPGAERSVIRGGSNAIHLVRPKYVIILDLEITGARGNGINADDGGDIGNPDAAHNVVFRNIHIHDIGEGGNQDGLKLSGLRDVTVIDCTIERCGGNHSGSGIDHVGCRGVRIARCTFRDLSANGVQCKGATYDVEIRDCRFMRAGLRGVNIGGSTALEYFRPPIAPDRPTFEARDIRVVRNTFEGGQTPVAFVGAVDCIVSGNTIIRPEKWALRILQETKTQFSNVRGIEGRYIFLECANNRFENNIICFSRAKVKERWEVNVGDATRPETFTFAGNLWYAMDDPGNSRPTLPAQEHGAIIGQDPMFVDMDAGDYRLRPGSPAARGGTLERVFRAPDGLEFGALIDRPAPGAPEDGRGWGVLMIGGGYGNDLDWTTPGVLEIEGKEQQVTITGEGHADGPAISAALTSRGFTVMRWSTIARGDPLRDQWPMRATPRTPQELLEHTRAALADLRASGLVDADKVILLGHSLGAARACTLAAEDEGVAGLILLAPAYFVKTDENAGALMKAGMQFGSDVLRQRGDVACLAIFGELDTSPVVDAGAAGALSGELGERVGVHVLAGLGHTLGQVEQSGDAPMPRVGPIDRRATELIADWAGELVRASKGR